MHLACIRIEIMGLVPPSGTIPPTLIDQYKHCDTSHTQEEGI